MFDSIKKEESDQTARKLFLVRKTGISEDDWADNPAGVFTMGSPVSEVGRSGNERQHQVQVQAFKMLKMPVTFVMYDAFCDATDRDRPSDEGWGRADRPVINVTYWDAVDYCEWLSELTSHQICLPTEAQWEYACRAGTTTAYWYGNESDHTRLHHREDLFGDTKQIQQTRICESNAWGLKDMHGKVFEWCASEWDEGYQGLEQRSAMADRTNRNPRILRGGSWSIEPIRARSAARFKDVPGAWSYDRGFRLAKITLGPLFGTGTV